MHASDRAPRKPIRKGGKGLVEETCVSLKVPFETGTDRHTTLRKDNDRAVLRQDFHSGQSRLALGVDRLPCKLITMIEGLRDGAARRNRRLAPSTWMV